MYGETQKYTEEAKLAVRSLPSVVLCRASHERVSTQEYAEEEAKLLKLIMGVPFSFWNGLRMALWHSVGLRVICACWSWLSSQPGAARLPDIVLQRAQAGMSCLLSEQEEPQDHAEQAKLKIPVSFRMARGRQSGTL